MDSLGFFALERISLLKHVLLFCVTETLSFWFGIVRNFSDFWNHPMTSSRLSLSQGCPVLKSEVMGHFCKILQLLSTYHFHLLSWESIYYSNKYANPSICAQINRNKRSF